MKLINLIIISILSISLIACGGDDDKKSKKKKKKEELGWEKADQGHFLKDCTGDSRDENLAKACECALAMYEENFDSYKEDQVTSK